MNNYSELNINSKHIIESYVWIDIRLVQISQNITQCGDKRIDIVSGSKWIASVFETNLPNNRPNIVDYNVVVVDDDDDVIHNYSNNNFTLVYWFVERALFTLHLRCINTHVNELLIRITDVFRLLLQQSIRSFTLGSLFLLRCHRRHWYQTTVTTPFHCFYSKLNHFCRLIVVVRILFELNTDSVELVSNWATPQYLVCIKCWFVSSSSYAMWLDLVCE